VWQCGKIENMKPNLLQRMCLHPNRSLRYQIWFSFGSISFIWAALIIVTSIAISARVGYQLQIHTESTLSVYVSDSVRIITEQSAETISTRINNIYGALSLLVEVVKDRFVGENWEKDRYVPFVDSITGRRMYPLATVNLPLDWNITSNVDEENYQEHIQEIRKDWYNLSLISTAHAVFWFQGQCDPSAEFGDPRYYPNCSVANNNIKTHGIIQPTESPLYERAGFLEYVLKPLYEAHPMIKTIGVYFFNDGAGASVTYPGMVRDGTSEYTSIGCSWMTENINSLTGRQFASSEQAARCHKDGDIVPSREYNPLERSWCRDQVLANGLPVMTGPYLDAFQADLWLLTLGIAVFDRLTGEFIACTLVDVSVKHIDDILLEFAQNFTKLFLTRWSDGNLLAGGGYMPDFDDILLNISSIDLSEQTFDALKDHILSKATGKTVENEIIHKNGEGDIVTAFPISSYGVNHTHGHPPHSMILTIVQKEIFDPIIRLDRRIDQEVSEIMRTTSILGIIGLIMVLLLSTIISRWLTQPLAWMQKISRQILHSDPTINHTRKPSMWLTPKTEIVLLVERFWNMINGFSGGGTSRIAHGAIFEVLNTIPITQNLYQLYCMDQNHQSFIQNSSQNYDAIFRQRRMRASFILASEEFFDLDHLSGSDNREEFIHNTEFFDVESTIASNKQQKSYKLSKREINRQIENSNSRKRMERESQIDSDGELQHPQLSRYSRIHLGCNLNSKPFEPSSTSRKHSNVLKSPLFWWMLLLLVIPILVIIFVINVLVLDKIQSAIPRLAEAVTVYSINLEKEKIKILTRARAGYAGEVLEEKVRDLHMLKRFSEWLLLNVIDRSDSFTTLVRGTELCKVFSDDMSCPFFHNNTLTPCDCEWKDKNGFQCNDFQENPRYLQQRFWVSQKRDSDPQTGSRSKIQLPYIETSPEKTSWWDDMSDIPGVEKKGNASGYETTYDRVRVLSALATIEFPIYNYPRSQSSRINHLGSYVGYEADGMLTGFAGCDYSHALFAHFKSTKENGAAAIRGDLCPLGKYGYDVRCRGWYADGKEHFGTYITEPYILASFVTKISIATRMTSSIYDPVMKKFIGQTLLDFTLDELFIHLSKTTITQSGSDFVFMITQSNDILGDALVFGPGYFFNESSRSAVDVILPHDQHDSKFRFDLESIVRKMKSGQSDTAVFLRTLQSGEQESIYVSFAPVTIRTMDSVNASDFARGVIENVSYIYSIAMAVPVDDMMSSFEKKNYDRNLQTFVIIYIVVSTISSLLATLLLSKVAIEITKPVIILCNIIEKINSNEYDEDILPMKGGSREVFLVYNSFAKLFKTVRLSNVAYFSGNVEGALKFLTDALRLYYTLDDEKAVGIALNNLGNTYLSQYLNIGQNVVISTVPSNDILRASFDCYSKAIKIAGEFYEMAVHSDAISDDATAEYAQTLADRYFSRALFLLVTKYDCCDGENVSKKSKKDLETASNLDTYVRDIWIQHRDIKSKSIAYFERLLRRAAGLLMIAESNLVDVNAFLFEADSLLCSVAKHSNASLFDSISICGRLQQLEEFAILSEIKSSNYEAAARYAVRMLVEDEYILESAFATAAEAILLYIERNDQNLWSVESVLETKTHIREMLRNCKSHVSIPSLEKKVLFSIDSSLLVSSESCEAIKDGIDKIYDRAIFHRDYISLKMISVLKSNKTGIEFTKKASLTKSTLYSCLDHIPESMPGTSLENGLRQILDGLENMDMVTWIIWVVDRTSWNDYEEWLSTESDFLFLQRACDLRLILIGIEFEEKTISMLRYICRQRNSTFIDTKRDVRSISQAFLRATTFMNGDLDLRGFAMETF
jgi:hypothetical protein